MIQKIALSLLGLVLVHNPLMAKDWSYSNKSKQISFNDAPVAQISKDKTDKIRSYEVSRIADSKPVLVYTRFQFIDTFQTETIFYYKVNNLQTGDSFYTGNFSEINMQKAIANQVIDNHLLSEDGSVNETMWKDYTKTGKNYPELFTRTNDSLMALVKISAPIAERDFRKPVEANKFGKLGQDNTVIGTWEMLEYQPLQGFQRDKEYCFLFKNLNGGIVAITWIRLSGFYVFTFDKDGKRTKESLSIGNPMKNSPVTNESDRYFLLNSVTALLIKKGLL